MRVTPKATVTKAEAETPNVTVWKLEKIRVDGIWLNPKCRKQWMFRSETSKSEWIRRTFNDYPLVGGSTAQAGGKNPLPETARLSVNI